MRAPRPRQHDPHSEKPPRAATPAADLVFARQQPRAAALQQPTTEITVDDTYLPRTAKFVNRPKIGSAARQRDRRRRLIGEAIGRHGTPGISILLEMLETEFGDALAIDRRLEQLVNASPTAVAIFAGSRQ